MSGGFFDYKNHLLNDWAEQLKQLILTNGKEDEFGYKREFNFNTLQIFYSAIFFSRLLEILLHEIDYMVEGDTSEEDIQKNVANGFVKFLEQERSNVEFIVGPEMYKTLYNNFAIHSEDAILKDIETKDDRQMEMFEK